MGRLKIARAADLEEGHTIKFQYPRVDKKPLEGFLARFRGKLVAYENVCRHLPLSLDFGGGQFFTADGAHFICQNHNAVYEPLTGLCVRGPCEGASLKPLKIEILDDEVWLAID